MLKGDGHKKFGKRQYRTTFFHQNETSKHVVHNQANPIGTNFVENNYF